MDINSYSYTFMHFTKVYSILQLCSLALTPLLATQGNRSCLYLTVDGPQHVLATLCTSLLTHLL